MATIARRSTSALFAVALAMIHPIYRSAAAEEKPPVSNEIVVTLLGTGGPEPTALRFGPATLVQAGGLNLLFDAGRGVTVRLYQLGISSGKGIDAVFLTHYHSDHVAGLPDLWMTGYMFGPFGSRVKPMRLWGPSDGSSTPSGVTKIAKGLVETFSDDMSTRQADEHIPVTGMQIEVHDFQADRVVFDEGGVKVSAFAVNHGDLIKPAVGYRIDYGAHSVTISGDTKLDENLIAHATGSDLLIHEVFAMSAQLAKLSQMKPIADHHTSPEEAGIVFARVKPRLAVYSHVILLQTTIPELLARTRSAYDGSFEVGEDLLKVTVGDQVVAKKWNSELRRHPD